MIRNMTPVVGGGGTACFLCLNPTSKLISQVGGNCSVKTANGQLNSESGGKGGVSCLKQICRFLNINLQTVLSSCNSTGVMNSFGGTMEGGGGGLEVNLCASCGGVLEKLEKLYKELELVQRKVDGVVRNVVGLLEGKEGSATTTTAAALEGVKGRDFVGVLREEMRSKCNQRLEGARSNVTVTKDKEVLRPRKTSRKQVFPELKERKREIPSTSVEDKINIVAVHSVRDNPVPKMTSKNVSSSPPENKDWRCDLCSFYFGSSIALSQHKRRAHPHLRLQSIQISTSTTPLKKFKPSSSAEEDTPSMSFTCALCSPPLTVGTHKGYHRHQIHHHVEAFFTDAKLDTVTPTEFKNYCTHAFQVELLEAPQRQTSADGNPVILCNICRKSYTNQYSLRFHLFTVHRDRMTSKILELQKRTTPEELRRIHLPPFSFEKRLRYKCDGCGATFAQDTSLYKHRKHKCPAVKAMGSGSASQEGKGAMEEEREEIECVPELLYTEMEEVEEASDEQNGLEGMEDEVDGGYPSHQSHQYGYHFGGHL